MTILWVVLAWLILIIGRVRLGEMDSVIEAYKKDIDRTLLRECLTLSPEERLERLIRMGELAEELRRAGGELARR